VKNRSECKEVVTNFCRI